MGRPRKQQEVQSPLNTIVEIEADEKEAENITIDPAEISGETSDNSSETLKKPRKKRGPNKAKAGSNKADLSGIANMIAFGTGLLAERAKIPELGLSLKEAEALDRGFTNVANQYDFPIFGDKAMAWVNLGLCVSMIGGSHYAEFAARTRGINRQAGAPIQGISQTPA